MTTKITIAELGDHWAARPDSGGDLARARARLLRAAAPWLHATSTRAVGQPIPFRNDEAVIRAAAAKDPRAFEWVVDRYLGRLVAKAQQSVARHDAEDIAQDTLMKFLEKAPQIREPWSLAGWLYGTLRRTLLKHLRDRAREEANALGSGEDGEDGAVWTGESGTTPEPAVPEMVFLTAVAREDRARLLDAIHATLSVQEELVIERSLAGVDDAAIAVELGIKQDYVRTLRSRAVRELRRRLGGGS